MTVTLANGAKGTLFYGLHAYAGVAEYTEPVDGRIFVNESTLRAMDPTFQGCPVFVHHETDINQDIDVLRGEADGWVIRSFFNEADGKHWAEFMVCSERGHEAIRKGYKLSNAYTTEKLGPAGIWNDVSYIGELQNGAYDHLALVPVARYNESIILTPEKFTQYCNEKKEEITRFSNNSEGKKMGLRLFKRTKVENSVDLESMCVALPKSKKELTLLEVVNAADLHFVNKEHGMAHPDHMVNVGDGVKMSVKDMCSKYASMSEELAGHRKKMENDDDAKMAKEGVDDEEEMHTEDKDKKLENDGDEDPDLDVTPAVSMSKSDKVENSEEELDEKKVKPEDELPEGEKRPGKGGDKMKKSTVDNASEVAKKAAEKAEAKKRADALRVANEANALEQGNVNFAMDQVLRGQQRYGSGR